MDTSSGTHANSQLRQERIARNWRQLDLAEQLGTTVGTIKRWERGSQQPSSYFRTKLSMLFGKSAAELGLLPGEPSVMAFVPEQIGLFSLPFVRNPFFTGRDTLLEHLHIALTNQPTTAVLTQSYSVHGLGGIGKTQLAIEYAYRYRHEYCAVLWVQAQTQASLTSSYSRLADVLGLPEHSEEDHVAMVSAVLRWLNGHKGWLLLFDNVEDLSLLKSFLPANDQGALLLTTRLQTLGTLAQRVPLSPMTLQEGCDFLLARATRFRQDKDTPMLEAHEQAAAQAIVTQMGGLPLALEQAGAYIDATGCRLSDYLQLFQQRQLHLLEQQEPGSDHPLSVKHTFLLCFQQVQQRSSLAADLLTASAYLAPEAIPDLFFHQGATWFGPTFEALQHDPLAFSEALKVLRSYSLIQRDASTQTISVHQLVQAVLQGRLTQAEHRTWRQRVIRVMSQLFPADAEMQANYLSLGEHLLTHAQTCLSWEEEPCDEEDVLRLSLMSHVAVYLTRRVRYGEAEPLFSSAIRQAERLLGGSHLLVAEVISGFAELYREQGNYTEAELLFERALDIREQTLPAHHLLIATSLGRLGYCWYCQGKYSQAEPLLLRALDLREQALDPLHPQMASSLLTLGILYREQGKDEQAELLLLRAVRLWEQALGLDHLALAAPLNALGLLYRGQGDYQRAEQVHQRALGIRQSAVGPLHPHVGSSLNNLGVLSYTQGNYQQAEQYFQRALHIWEQALGPLHPHVGSSLNNLGNLSHEQDNYSQAEQYYQRALHIWEQAFGQEHPKIAVGLANLGNLSYEQGNYQQAKRYYQQALHIWEQALGQEHPDVAYALHGLANVSREQGLYEQAGLLYQRALSIRQQQLSPQHLDLADTLHDLARFHQLLQHRSEALSFYQQALVIRQQVYGQEHPKTRRTQEALTQLAQDMMQNKEANSGEALALVLGNTLVCACGCGRSIDRSKSHGEPRRFFSAACRQRVYRHALRHKRHARSEFW